MPTSISDLKVEDLLAELLEVKQENKKLKTKLTAISSKYRKQAQAEYMKNKRISEKEDKYKKYIFDLSGRLLEISPDITLEEDIELIRKAISRKN